MVIPESAMISSDTVLYTSLFRVISTSSFAPSLAKLLPPRSPM